MKYFYELGAIPEFSVTEITGAVQRLMHDAFYCIKVRGEISGLSRPSSGHVYLSLKDANSVINAVCWNGTNVKAAFCNGLEVICTGYLSTYQSKYQLIIEEMVLVGHGKLALILEERKKKLASEGIFDPSNKKKLPLLPTKVGIITSLTGAVIQDILDRVKHRFPTHLVIWSVQVQGDQASSMIINAIQGFNNMPHPPDVIVVARGGGSIEDLWPFNDEALARATAQSGIPIVSAVGHETDTTIIDYAADVRASTPTASVEIILPEKQQLLDNISNRFTRIKGAVQNLLKIQEHRLLKLHGTLVAAQYRTMQAWKSVLEYQGTIKVLLQVILLKKKQHLDNLISRIACYDTQHMLTVGYTIVYDEEGRRVSSAEGLLPSKIITIEWKDGKRKAVLLT